MRAPDTFTDMVWEQLATTSTTLKELQKGGAAVRLAQTATVSGGVAVRKSEFLSNKNKTNLNPLKKIKDSNALRFLLIWGKKYEHRRSL